MEPFVPGQRWVSVTEPELGLGIVSQVDARTVKIRFNASLCTRTYTLSAPPVKRVTFNPGDTVTLLDDRTVTISHCRTKDHLMVYQAQDVCFDETKIGDSVSLSLPENRLLAGITDTSRLFDLRLCLHQAKARYDASPVKGFIGGQVALMPHQFYIAQTIADRFYPRVLLADETGLGKTIEAGLVIHKLLISHMMQRILIIVPQSLQHQWFIELYRKFNLSFMLVSEKDIMHDDAADNPFTQHQQIITAVEMLADPETAAKISKAGWDMIVIDEAHHVNENEIIFEQVQYLSRKTKGLMLITATPEQMGTKSHFKSLALIDPDKYFDYDQYCRQAQDYHQTADRLEKQSPDKADFDKILDTFGPGRVMFRNKRQVVENFPKRIPHIVTLKGTEKDREAANIDFSDSIDQPLRSLSHDPRIRYLVDLARQGEKLLVICRTKEKVNAVLRAVESHLRIDMARFDESMTLMQRDRNAAWFAQPDGAKILLCSEIGSEGRNFQFVHHLFLFDLPLNPELLVQRIGRLDRIGQKKDIHIHIPVIRNTGMEILGRWYHEGLDIFNRHLDGAYQIFNLHKVRLFSLIAQTIETGRIDEKSLAGMVNATKKDCKNTKAMREKGQDILLAFNSFRPQRAQEIVDRIHAFDENPQLNDLMPRLWDAYGIEVDFFSKEFFKLNFESLTDESFPRPDLTAETFTLEREPAIVRDEVGFMTWDHPFVHQTIEFFLTNLTGSCALAKLTDQQNPGLLIEAVFIMECTAPLELNMPQYLSGSPIRILVDHHLKKVSRFQNPQAFSDMLLPDKPHWFKEMDEIREHLLGAMIKKAMDIAVGESVKPIQQGKEKIKMQLIPEIKRLIELKKINPGIRDDEIEAAEQMLTERLKHIQKARPRLDALRLIRVMP